MNTGANEGLLSLKEINLLPWREDFKEFQRKQFIFFLGCAAAVSFLIIVGLHFLLLEQNDRQLERNNYLAQQIALADKQIVEIDGLMKERQQLVDRMSVIQRLQANRPNVVKIFDGIAKSAPDGLYFTNVSRAQSKIHIEGKAESNIRVSSLMRNIEASNWLAAPVLSFIEAEENTDKNINKDKATYQPKLSEEGILFNLNAQQVFAED